MPNVNSIEVLKTRYKAAILLTFLTPGETWNRRGTVPDSFVAFGMQENCSPSAQKERAQPALRPKI
jgi:hypothetical protein